MSKIKKFFARKKEEASAFKLKLTGSTMGAGHKLNDPKQEAPASSKSRKKYEAYVPPNRNELSNEARAAANAALARIDKKNSREFNTSMAAIKAQAKRELEAEKRQKEEEQASAEAKASTTTTSAGENRNLACEGVFFRCPMISEELLPKNEWKVRIKEFLYQQLETDRGLTGCLIIHNCNPKEKADECIATLIKYLENLINNPTEEKFCKIRMTNKIFSEKVRYVEGALDVLQAAGFNEVEMDGEPYLLWTRDRTEQDLDLPTLVDALKNSEIIPLQLDRNIKVLLPSQARRVALPDDFFRMTQADIKKEQQLRAEAVAKSQMLMTKAMREREEQRNLRMYRYALVRVKFPNGLFIQGTFNVYEKISDVVEFVQSCLADESLLFTLISANEGRFGEEDMEKTLFDCKLIPNSLMLFNADEVSKPVEADMNYLKEELLMLVQDM